MLLSLRNVSKIYQIGNSEIKALQNVSVDVNEGEFLAVMGPSGSGKSTFLQIASMLGAPSKGKILLKNKDVTAYSEAERAVLRNREIGFVFQQFNLLARTSALENVMLPLSYAGVALDEQKERAKDILSKLGLADRIHNTPAQLSGGQQQRVAIARALVNNPSIIFADEPTGNLDSKSGQDIQDLLKKLHLEKKTIIMVTHDAQVAKIAKRMIVFADGEIIQDNLIQNNDNYKKIKKDKEVEKNKKNRNNRKDKNISLKK